MRAKAGKDRCAKGERETGKKGRLKGGGDGGRGSVCELMQGVEEAGEEWDN